MSAWSWHGTAAVLAIGVALVFGGVGPGPAWAADDVTETRQLVERARLTVESFAADPQIGEAFAAMAKKARAIFIAPSVLRGAFIFGVSGGSGVTLARAGQPGQWNGPAFYTMGEASFGLQIGGDAAEIVLFALTDRGVSALLAPSVKLGAQVSLAAGPYGAGAAAATANLSADIISYVRAKGLYAGVSVDGSVVGVRTSLNHAYYGKEVSPTDILISGTVKNPDAAPLIQTLNKAGGM
jgi:lipid-binding SYLF domain-containing protein